MQCRILIIYFDIAYYILQDQYLKNFMNNEKTGLYIDCYYSDIY